MGMCVFNFQLSCDGREHVYFISVSSSNRKYESLIIQALGHEKGTRCMSH